MFVVLVLVVALRWFVALALQAATSPATPLNGSISDVVGCCSAPDADRLNTGFGRYGVVRALAGLALHAAIGGAA